jgi:hypothetical protein
MVSIDTLASLGAKSGVRRIQTSNDKDALLPGLVLGVTQLSEITDVG